MGLGALVATARQEVAWSGSAPPAVPRSRPRPRGSSSGPSRSALSVAAAKRSGRRVAPLAPAAAGRTGGLGRSSGPCTSPSTRASLLHSWVILPQPYVEGLKYLATNDTGGSPGFLLGVSWTGANVWFWPATLLVKLSTPDPGPARGRPAGTGRPGPLGPDQPVDLAPDPGGGDPAGRRALRLRTAQPAHAGGAVPASRPSPCGSSPPRRSPWWSRRRLAAMAVGVVLAWPPSITVYSFPHSIAYTARAVPPRLPGGHRLQRGLGPGLRPPHHLEPGSASLRGVLRPAGRDRCRYRRGPPAASALRPTRISGWVAASASDLTSAERDSLSWLRAYCPVGTLGGSILLYHFTVAPTSAAGPSAPASLCAAEPSVTG